MGLPNDIDTVFVYGYEFKSLNTDTLFSSNLSVIQIKDKSENFDNYLKIKSRNSIGSLVFFERNNKICIFGIYNPFSENVINLNLIRGNTQQQIKNARF